MFLSYIKSKRFAFRFIFLIVLFAHLIVLIQNYSFFIESMRLGFGFTYAYRQLFDIENTFSIYSLIVACMTIFLSAFNFSIIWEYLKLQNNITKKYNSLFGLGTIMALIGTYCISCVSMIFGGLLSASVLSVLPFGGNEIGLLGICILLYTSYMTIKKLNQPYTC